MSTKYSGLEAALRSARMTFVSEAEAGDRTGAHDAYQTGDRVTYNGQIYESTIDNNVWSPDTYPQGWKLVGPMDGGAA